MKKIITIKPDRWAGLAARVEAELAECLKPDGKTVKWSVDRVCEILAERFHDVARGEYERGLAAGRAENKPASVTTNYPKGTADIGDLTA